MQIEGKLDAYQGELKAIISTLRLAYCNANLNRVDGDMFLTVILALERLAAKIEQVDE